ncbi:hypothetical protein [uncultured Campylobacter sp.]|uniref:hypothetical protein n=1 Tax=uncultured Campylobacter sp. TaxID=218934 RepID=UPI002610BF3B|nr:hypothetical protein [uncultured Campylobacter sp.]
MKDIKIPIISGLSLAACLAIAPSQALAGNGVITVTKSDGTPSPAAVAMVFCILQAAGITRVVMKVPVTEAAPKII